MPELLCMLILVIGFIGGGRAYVRFNGNVFAFLATFTASAIVSASVWQMLKTVPSIW